MRGVPNKRKSGAGGSESAGDYAGLGRRGGGPPWGGAFVSAYPLRAASASQPPPPRQHSSRTSSSASVARARGVLSAQLTNFSLITPLASSPLLRRHLEHQVEPDLVAEACAAPPGFPYSISWVRSYARIDPLAIVRLLLQRGTRVEGPGVVAQECLDTSNQRSRSVKGSAIG
jgi:hypothetical protein